MQGALDVRRDAALEELVERVRQAQSEGRALGIQGGGTKAFLSAPGLAQEERLSTAQLRGISSYEPSELVITARAGTPLAEVEAALAEQGQCLAFEPPRFGDGGTVGGMVAAGLAGPSRATVGAVRDFMLGATLLNGRAEVLSFGGQVMKNVAGYDVSRLLAGSQGVLGVILEVSIKVLPRQPASATLRFEMNQAQALRSLNEWGGQPLPLSASAWWDGMLVLRLSGARAAVDSAVVRLGGERIDDDLAQGFWEGLRDQRDEFFLSALNMVRAGGTLWRASVPQTAVPLNVPGDTLIEWGGAQRWLTTASGDAAAEQALLKAASAAGGHVQAFRGARVGQAPALDPVLLGIHRQLKLAFDPRRVFNRGRLHPEL